jgi:60 kDa SS-A/Ro ribonucleoprotein
MPMTAMIRNLGKMSTIGLLAPLSDAARVVADRLADEERIRRSRLHPMAILLAAKVYAQGRGDKGKLTWKPVPTINDALDAAFYLAFGNVRPTGKRRLLAIDVSGSMDGSMAAGTSLTCREAAAALSLIVAKTEPNYHLVAFAAPTATQARMKTTSAGLWSLAGQVGSYPNLGLGGQWGGGDSGLAPLDLSGCSRITEAVSRARAIPMGGTDCSLPMRVAVREGWEVDSFEVYTDNETWAGPIHPCQALREYRERSGIPAKLVVQAFTATPFTIADPDDSGSLDVVGLDAAAPAVVADFLRGDRGRVDPVEPDGPDEA